MEVPEDIGATRRSRTGDLLITKNSMPTPNLSQPEKKQQKTLEMTYVALDWPVHFR